jgi:hypothetical protein
MSIRRAAPDARRLAGFTSPGEVNPEDGLSAAGEVVD